MWYDQAQEYLLLATLIGAVGAFLTRRRVVAIAIAAFGAGIYVGILAAASGTLKLPLGPMQAQMHAVWGIPAASLEPPHP